MEDLSVPVCSADGYGVDSVDVLRLMLHARLNAVHQCLDLGAAQVVVDVNPPDVPHSVGADEGEEKFANGGHAGVPQEEGSYPLLISWPEWLGEARHPGLVLGG